MHRSVMVMIQSKYINKVSCQTDGVMTVGGMNEWIVDEMNE